MALNWGAHRPRGCFDLQTYAGNTEILPRSSSEEPDFASHLPASHSGTRKLPGHFLAAHPNHESPAQVRSQILRAICYMGI